MEFLAGALEELEKGYDHSLIPTDIQAWYFDSSDEEDTVSEGGVILKRKNQVMFQILIAK